MNDPRDAAEANIDAARQLAEARAGEVRPEPTGPLPPYVGSSGLDVTILRPRKRVLVFALTEAQWRDLWLLENPHRWNAQTSGHAPDRERVARRFGLTFMGPGSPDCAAQAIEMARAVAGHALDETRPARDRQDRQTTDRADNRADHRARRVGQVRPGPPVSTKAERDAAEDARLQAILEQECARREGLDPEAWHAPQLWPDERERWAIIGSRLYPEPLDVLACVAALPPHVVVVSGGARRVDTWAVWAAEHRGHRTETIPAEWKRLGFRAGPIRNAQIIESVVRVLAFPHGEAKGTRGALELASAEARKRARRGLALPIFIHEHGKGWTRG